MKYPLAGALLATGAPLGLLLLRRFVLAENTLISQDLRRDRATYAYLTISTTLVFALLGRLLGRNAERLAELSTVDGLTGLLNRRAFYTRLRAEMERSRRTGSAMSLLLIDLDELKVLNDRHGHAIGDRALQKLARAIRREMRSIDTGARLGGDEFGFIAVGTTETAAQVAAERLQNAIADERGVDDYPISASIGIVAFDPSRDPRIDVRELMRAADRALYDAKRAGRNRIAIAQAASGRDSWPA